MSHAHAKAAAGLESLEPLVGKWHTEGRRFEGPFGPAAPFVAVETFEWLQGGQFLVHRLDGHFAAQPAACVEVLGRRAQGELFAETFYNDGQRNVWVVKADGQALSWSGASPTSSAEKPLRLRYIVTFEDAGNTLVGKWEQSSDGRTWSPLLEARATKAQPLPDSSIGI